MNTDAEETIDPNIHHNEAWTPEALADYEEAKQLIADYEENLERVLGVFANRGWQSHDAVLEDHDKDADWEAVRDIGPVFAPIMKHLMGLTPAKWRDVTGLEYNAGEETTGNHPDAHGDVGTGKMSVHDPE